MATILVANDILEIKVASTMQDQHGINVLHYRVTSTSGVGGTDVVAAAAFDNIAAPLYKPLMNIDAKYFGVRVQKIRPLPITPAQVSVLNTGVGTAAGNPIPNQVSGIITKTTAFAGRANRGRTYVPFPAASFNLAPNDTPTAAYVALLDALGIVLFAPMALTLGADTVNVTPVLFHRRTGFNTPITNFRSRQLWATQRRRGNYGTANTLPPF